MLTKLYPAKLENDALQPAKATSSGNANFLEKTSHILEHHGRLVLALDATASRQNVWNIVSQLQSNIFSSAGQKTGISLQLVYYRGTDECRASKWVSNAQSVYHLMGHIQCEGQVTQLSKILSHTGKENSKKRISAMIFIGDNVTEDAETLIDQAKSLGKQGVRAIMMQDGIDSETERVFREISRVTNGAFLQFDSRSTKPLENGLAAIATFATKGFRGLGQLEDETARLLLNQLQKPSDK